MEIIPIGCTRAGLVLKKELIAHLEQKGFAVEDLGMREDGEFVPYHRAAMAVAETISSRKYRRGIIICGTGAGSVITAAKFKGVYPVHVTDVFMAERARAVNDCNVLVFGEWLTPPQHACRIVDAWLETEFGTGVDEAWKRTLRGFYEEIQAFEEEQFAK